MEDAPVSDPAEVDDRPASFREVLASTEYRAIFSAGTLSTLGDSMARAAVTGLVYHHTHSVLFASATFAISYLPWLGFGPILTAVAERYPYRRTMVVCDLARMVTIGLVAVPGIPIPALLLLLLLTAVLSPPFGAARSALVAHVLDGDRYVVGIALQESAAQVMLITGYFVGGVMVAVNPRYTIALDAATFGISACVLGLWVTHREPALRPDRRTHLLREAAEGFRVVFGRPVLRSIAIVVFGALLFSIVPEGLGAAWADLLSPGDSRAQGWMQGLIMCCMPLGFTVGSLSINRLVRPATRQLLIRPFAVVIPLALSAAVFSPPIWGVVLIGGVIGFATAALLPAANGLFVRALPGELRARAFGVMQAGVQLFQGAGVFVTGALASRFSIPHVVGAWGAAGVVVMLLACLTWPRPEVVDEAITEAKPARPELPEAVAVADPDSAPALAAEPAPPRRPSPRPVLPTSTEPTRHDRVNGHANKPPPAPMVTLRTGPRHAAPDSDEVTFAVPDHDRRGRHAAPEEPAEASRDDVARGRHAAPLVDGLSPRVNGHPTFWRQAGAGTRSGGDAGRMEG
jgi:MFS family permease